MAECLIFLDRDGTVKPEPVILNPGLAMMRSFHEVAFGRDGNSANKYLRRLITLHNAKLVWNSRNPDVVERPKGRLYSRNGRSFGDAAAEHVRLLKESGIPDEWFLPQFPEVVHCKTQTKGEAMMAFVRQSGTPMDRVIAFDNDINEMKGFPLDRVIAVDPLLGITLQDYRKAEQLFASVTTASPKTSPRPSRPSA
jgi:hypothetical protein